MSNFSACVPGMKGYPLDFRLELTGRRLYINTMKCFSFAPGDLPVDLPIFPLSGGLLLPRGELPLNIFEDRYIAMVDEVLRTPSRMIGMIQPRSITDPSDPFDLYRVGCAGRISQLEETMDGRYLIRLKGICRFRIVDEIAQLNGFRRVRASYDDYVSDLTAPDEVHPEAKLDRARFMRILKEYFDVQGLSCNWDDIKAARDDHLMTALSMVCPFTPDDKQKLLETTCPIAFSDCFLRILECAILHQEKGEKDTCPHTKH